MIPLPLYSAFIAVSLVLLIMPGPNVALIVSNSLAHGRKFGLITVAGASSAMIVQLGLTVLGMSALLAGMAAWFSWLRWIGVAYLLYLGVRAWLARAQDFSKVPPDARATAAIYVRGFLVSLTNPKTLLFFGAFLPQFVSVAQPLIPQLLLLAATFLVFAVLLDSCWAVLAARLRFLLGAHGRLRNRITGGCYIGAGLGLALARKP
jgi:threonine/homoserine/homoserine lactone efflux protein